MAEDYINWAKLVEYPVYNASMMKPCPEFESSIVSISSGSVFTPDSAYEDTVKDKDAFNIRVFSRRYTESGKNASVTMRMGKEDFTRIMCECVKVKPKKYVWEHPDFHTIFENCITDLCKQMNTLGIGELFVRSGKTYVLSHGNGLIYNDDLVSGAFSGFVMTVTYSPSDGVSISLDIPRLVHNSAAGNLSNATLVYEDKDANVKFSIQGSALSVKAEDTYEAKGLKNGRGLTISRIDTTSGVYFVPEDEHSDLLTKRLRVPTTRFDFRLAGVLPTVGSDTEALSQVPMQFTLNRLASVRR